MLPASIFLALTFWIFPAFPDSESSVNLTQALQSFKEGDLAKSRDSFLQLLATHPRDPVLLYNLGLVELKDQHPGRALAYWRKALYLSPGFSPAITGLSQLDKIKNIDFSPSLIDPIYWRFSLSQFLVVLWLSICFSSLWGLRRLQQKRLENQMLPFWPLGVGFAFCVIFSILTAHRFWKDFLHERGMIIVSPSQAHSSPSPDAPALFDFKEGDEVVVHRRQDDWLQVQKGATASGWVKKEEVLVYGF